MKTVRTAVLWAALLGLLYVAADGFLGTHDDVFTEEGLLTADASQLAETTVTPHLEVPLGEGRSVLWCASFQLAWNEACAWLGQDLHFGSEPPMVRLLNKKSFTKGDIDADSYVAVAGAIEEGVYERIHQQLQDKFEGQAAPQFIPSRELVPRPQDVVVYAYLFKNLEFLVPFERIEEPIEFEGEMVPCFGIGEEFQDEHLQMFEQFLILDYRSEDDFVVEFQTKSEGDRVVLAKVPPEPTFEATIRAVQGRVAGGVPAEPEIGDILKVPKLNFDITRRYTELENKRLLHQNPGVAGDLTVLSAIQNIRYQFDERGVRLRSESHIAFGCGGRPPPPSIRHVMVFDKPFLLMLQRRGAVMLQGPEAGVPYFAVWVGSPEILVN